MVTLPSLLEAARVSTPIMRLATCKSLHPPKVKLGVVHHDVSRLRTKRSKDWREEHFDRRERWVVYIMKGDPTETVSCKRKGT